METSRSHFSRLLIFYCGCLSLLGVLTWALYLNRLNPLKCHAIFIHGLLTLGLLMAAVLIPGWMYFRYGARINSTPRHYKFVLHVLTFLVVIFCLLLGSETFFRIFPIYDMAAVNPGCFYFRPGRPWNSLGHKDREFSFAKSPRQFRILVVGDSVVEGVGVELSETFAAVLERQLNACLQMMAPVLSVEVFNLGHSGRNTEQEVNLVLRDSPLLTPDLVVLAYVLNDAEHSAGDARLAATPPWLSKIHELFTLRLHSYAYYWLFRHITLFTTSYKTYTEVCYAQHQPDYIGWQTVEQSLDQYKKYLETTHVDDLAVIFPMFEPGDYPQQLRDIHAQVAQAFSDRNLDMIDLLPLFEAQHGTLDYFRVSADDGHPNRDAHNLVGSFLANVILRSSAFQTFIRLHYQRQTDPIDVTIEQGIGIEYREDIATVFKSITAKDYTNALKLLDTIIEAFEQALIPKDMPYVSVATQEQYGDYVIETQRENTVWIDWAYREAYFLKAVLAFEAQEFEQAFHFLDQVLTFSPYDSEARCARGNILNRLKKPTEALQEYQLAYTFAMRYASQQADRAVALQGMAYAYRALGDLNRAGLAYREALKYTGK